LEFHTPDGAFQRQLTDPESGYRRFVDADPVRGLVWVEASRNPTRTNVCQVTLGPGRGGSVMGINEAPGLNGAVFSKNHVIWVHTFDGLKGERRQTVTRIGSEHDP